MHKYSPSPEQLAGVFTDAKDGWPDSITVRFHRDYQHSGDDGSSTTISGEASFTYTRTNLTDAGVQEGKRLFLPGANADGSADFTLKEGEFLPMRTAVGKMPGWVVIFGLQKTRQGCYTYTYTPKDGQPQTTKQDQDCNVSMSCAPVAPGRFYPAVSGGFVGLPNTNLGLRPSNDFDDLVQGAVYTVTQLSPGEAATSTRPERGPIYRVTIPDEAVYLCSVGGLTCRYNGTKYTFYGQSAPPSGEDGVNANAGVSDYGEALVQLGSAFGGQAWFRSPFVCELELPHFGDTLTAGTIDYLRSSQEESTIFVNGHRFSIGDPFALSGQSFTDHDEDTGLTITAQL